MPAGLGARFAGLVLRYGDIQQNPPCPAPSRRVGLVADYPSGTYQLVDNANTQVLFVADGVQTVEKIGGSAYGDASAVSSAGIAGDFVLRITSLAIPGGVMVGMNSDPLTDNNYTSIDYAWNNPHPALGTIYESGASISSPGGSTYHWIWRVGTTLYYGRGADLATAQVTPDRTVPGVTATLYFDSAFLSVGDKVEVLLADIPPAQALTPSLFTNSQSFFAVTVSATYALAPTLYTNSASFFAPTVAPGVATLSPGLFTNSQSFFAPTVTRGAVSLSPSLFTNAQSFFAPTVAAGAVTLAPPLFTDGDTFFAPTVSQGSGGISPDLFVNSQTFFSPAVSTTYTLAAGMWVNVPFYFGPTVTSVRLVLPTLFRNQQRFFRPRIVATIWDDEADLSAVWTAETQTGVWEPEPANDAVWASETASEATWDPEPRPTGTWS